jgi:hypothetical protein
MQIVLSSNPAFNALAEARFKPLARDMWVDELGFGVWLSLST